MMKLYIFSGRKTTVQAKPAAQLCLLSDVKNHKPERGDVSYLDVQTVPAAEQDKYVRLFGKKCAGTAWGIADPKNAVDDPAALFFAGAADYMGAAACRCGISKSRLKDVLSFFESRMPELPICTEKPAETLNIRPSDFPGWKAVREGASYPFCLLHASAHAKIDIKGRLGDAGYALFMDRFKSMLQQQLADAEPLLWMETESNLLYLLPPKRSNVAAAAEAALRVLVAAPLIAYERLHLPFPIDFVFAAHLGTTEYARPGKTGTIVSDAINYSYHLGCKAAQPGRLTVSRELFTYAIPQDLSDLFLDAGLFEDRPVMHSRRFCV